MSLLSTLKFVTNHPLNRDHKISPILRFARWQIGSRLVPGAVVYDWINGSKLLAAPGETGVTGNLYAGLHEFSDMGFLPHFLRSDDLFVDVGANVGSYTVLACAAVGASGVAIEPVPSTFKRLVANIRLNHLETAVECVNKGIGAREGSVAFTRDSDTTNHALAEGEQCADVADVDIVRLDTVLKNRAPVLIKIDVEGYETAVLEGGKRSLQKQTLKAVVMELNGSGKRYGYDESRILELMGDLGFKAFSYNPLERTLVSLEGKNREEGNTLFIRDRPFVEERLRTAQKVAVNGRDL